jgi:serine/threonine protein kinase
MPGRGEYSKTTADESAPEEFGPYIVYERLGVGGMATVHRAKKRGIAGFERGVALKRMLPHLAEDAEFINSFVREAKLASLLVHPNIAQIYDFGRVGNVYYIAMEHVDGFDVRKMLRYSNRHKEPLPLNVVMSILCELCDALEYAHTFVDDYGQPQGIVHRDVSPSNLIVAQSGHLKVIDFGIAKANVRQLHTESGRVKGKLGYMSPEALSGRAFGPVSDVFSAAVVAHELLTAHPLFSAKTDYETLIRIHEAEIPPPSRRNPSVPALLDEVILAALSRDPERRLMTAGAFREALEYVTDQSGIRFSARDVAEWRAKIGTHDAPWGPDTPMPQVSTSTVTARVFPFPESRSATTESRRPVPPLPSSNEPLAAARSKLLPAPTISLSSTDSPDKTPDPVTHGADLVPDAKPARPLALAAAPEAEPQAQSKHASQEHAPSVSTSMTPYRGDIAAADRGLHPLVRQLVAENAHLSPIQTQRVNDFVRRLSDLDTHTPLLGQLAILAVHVESYEVIPKHLCEAIDSLHAAWRIDGIQPAGMDDVLRLFRQARARLDRLYTLGLRGFLLAPLMAAILYILEVSPILITMVFAAFALAATTGGMAMQLVSHRRKELDEMSADLRKFLPPLQHREVQLQRLKEMSSGGETE